MENLSVLREPAVRARLSVGKTKLWEMWRSGQFPAPIRLGTGRAVGWYSHEVDQWLASRPRAGTARPKPAAPVKRPRAVCVLDPAEDAQ